MPPQSKHQRPSRQELHLSATFAHSDVIFEGDAHSAKAHSRSKRPEMPSTKPLQEALQQVKELHDVEQHGATVMSHLVLISSLFRTGTRTSGAAMCAATPTVAPSLEAVSPDLRILTHFLMTFRTKSSTFYELG